MDFQIVLPKRIRQATIQCICSKRFGSTLNAKHHGQLAMTQVVVLEFSRSPQWFLECIVSGEALAKHRSAMLAVGRPCIFAEGVKLLAIPEEVNDVLLHLSCAEVRFDEHTTFSWEELRPRHMIVSKSLEAEVLAAIAKCPGTGKTGGQGKDHVRVKRRVIIEIPRAAWYSQADKGFLLSFSF
jgi:hypothetical protein